MSVKKVSKQAVKTQKQQSRNFIAEKISELLDKYRSKKKVDEFGKTVRKASKILSKVVVVPIPAKTAPRKAKKAAAPQK